MKILDVPQRSTAWSQARLGVVTASEIDALVTPLWKIRTGEGPETFMHKKLCEKLLGWSPDSGGTWEMEQGNIIETIALPWFAFTYDCEPKRVGFCLSDDGRTGCSPDALLGEDGGLELKAPQPPTHLKYLLRGVLPPEYAPQVQFSLYVTKRARWTFASFSRQLDPLVVEVLPDPTAQQAIECALHLFFEKFDAAYSKIKGKMDAENAAKEAAYNEANPNR